MLCSTVSRSLLANSNHAKDRVILYILFLIYLNDYCQNLL